MMRQGLMAQWSISFSAFCFITTAQAGIPLWRFTPDVNFPPKTMVSPTGSAVVKYTVSNNSSKPHNLLIKPQAGVSQSGSCLLGPKGSATANCQLTLNISGSALTSPGLSSGPSLCQSGADGSPNLNHCYQPNQADSLAIGLVQGTPILSFSLMNLGLSVKDTATHADLTGNPRQITLSNTGDVAATGLLVNYPSWPGGSLATSASNDCGSTLSPGDSCTITVTPGSRASSGADDVACTAGIAPIPGIVSVSASNASPISTHVVVLGYGCIYQGGFIYSLDDTTPMIGSIGGKTAAVTDTFPGQTITNQGIPNWGAQGTSIGSDLHETNPQGANDGRANSAAIISALTTNYSEPPYSGASAVPLSNYAAGLCNTLSVDALGASSCTTPSTCYTDWYLPAICELGPFNAQCTLGSTNIQQQLFENALIPSATLGLVNAGGYWSSTELASVPNNRGISEFFQTGASYQISHLKSYRRGVRCSRALTL